MDNLYYEQVLRFQESLKSYVDNILRTYGRELVLRLEEYNLLQSRYNCIESSTAIGFVLEEFLVAKLEMYTHCQAGEEYVINRFVGATASESYDCYALANEIKFMVNIKAEKFSSNNNAIAAIGQLYRNYCIEDPDQSKAYIILKVKYDIGEACEDSPYRRATPRHIAVSELETYCLEEIDFSRGHRQDHRSWSSQGSRNNGRLQVSSKFRQDNPVPIERISYPNTVRMLSDLYKHNE